MTPRRRRMVFVGVIVTGVAVAAALTFMALGENMLYFYSPTQVQAGEVPKDRQIRVGGMVVEGSVQRGEGLRVSFDLTDTAKTVTVHYEGILPDLFREGQGIVARGSAEGGQFTAVEVLAKHDENYMPPEVAEAMAVAKAAGQPDTDPPTKDANQPNQ